MMIDRVRNNQRKIRQPSWPKSMSMQFPLSLVCSFFIFVKSAAREPLFPSSIS